MAYITNVDSTILPYNDADMKYDIDLRQYVLTQEGFTKLTGMDFSGYTDSEDEKEAFLKENSTRVYETVFQYSLVTTVKVKRWLIAKDDTLREDFKRALAYQCRYALRSGGNLIPDMHGVNIEKSKVIDISQLRGRVTIAFETENILKRTGLLYSGFLYYSQFEDDGTY